MLTLYTLPTLLRPRRSDFRFSCEGPRCPRALPLLSVTRRSSPTHAFLHWPWARARGGGVPRQGSGEGWAFWQVTQSCRFLISGLPAGASLGGAPPPRSFPDSHPLAGHPGLEWGFPEAAGISGARPALLPPLGRITLGYHCTQRGGKQSARALVAGRQRRVNFALDHLESCSRPVVKYSKDRAVVLWKS